MIRKVTVYSARYAHLGSWPLRLLLNELAGRTVDLGTEWDAFKRALCNTG